MNLYFRLSLIVSFFYLCLQKADGQDLQLRTDVLIIGGGASGTTAAIQCSRMGVKTIVVEATPWLGGMLTAAGVSAIDGNHNMPSGLWGEFRQKLYDYYGGPSNVETGWVSNTLFEPAVADRILKKMAVNSNLSILYDTEWNTVTKGNDGLWQVTVKKGRKTTTIRTKILIDATELGDVLAYLKVPYSIGMDSRQDTGEEFAPEKSNDIIQDMTYVVTLKDFGKGADKTIKRPKGYDPSLFRESCDVSDPSQITSPDNNCYKMMQYGRLPNNKYMINWPKGGNDIYLNIIEKSAEERAKAIEEAKLHSLRFVYYIQKELGFKNLGIAEDEYPTRDHLPMIPYHRESRRMKGLVTLTLNDVAQPYGQKTALYRTGIAVGDYPIDHHHLKNTAAPAIDFVKIKVPSYNVPLGSLIPASTDGLIVAEKSISVSNIVNGATRLQPVVLSLGQAAGTLAAVAVKAGVQPGQVSIRAVQQELLKSRAYLMPFIDVKPQDPHFEAIQRIGATGILKGTGVPYKWANQTWFYPENFLSEYELATGLKSYYPVLNSFQAQGKALTVEVFSEMLAAIKPDISVASILAEAARFSFADLSTEQSEMNRRHVAVLTDALLKPFDLAIDFKGGLLNPSQSK